MSSIAQFSKNLFLDSNGIWCAKTHSTLSYPECGNERCFQIEDRSFWFKHRNNCILSLITQYPPSGPILDVGGGNGFVTRRILDQGFDAVLLEPGPTGARNAKTQRKIPEVICATLEDADFPVNCLSAVGLFDVLEHIDDEKSFLSRICHCLSPGGMLYVSVPASRWLRSASDDSAGHYRRYSRHSLTRVLTDRFEILYMTYMFRILVAPIFLFRALPYRLGWRRSVFSVQAEHGCAFRYGECLLERVLSRECKTIAQGRPVALGASCLCAARKK